MSGITLYNSRKIGREIEVGDRIRVFGGRRGNYLAESAIVDKILSSGDINYKGDNMNYHNYCHPDDCELLTNKLKDKNIMSTIKEKFVLAFLGEPEKSFRKTEITNGDGFLTSEGQGVFLAWLLKKNGVDFKKEVVDDMLKDLEDKE